MVSIGALWLPILLSAALVFVASSLFWMVVRHHDSDWKGLPDEAAILEAFRRAKVPRGQYRFPWAEARQMQTPEMQKKMAEGPAGFLIYWDRYTGGMGKNLGQWFVYLAAVSLFIAYLTGRVLPAGSAFAAVFRVAGTAAVLAYCAAHVPGSIWWGRSWSATAKDVVDGIVYGLITGAIFGWLWPR
jgi:Flp pilus assembly protein TadB